LRNRMIGWSHNWKKRKSIVRKYQMIRDNYKRLILNYNSSSNNRWLLIRIVCLLIRMNTRKWMILFRIYHLNHIINQSNRLFLDPPSEYNMINLNNIILVNRMYNHLMWFNQVLNILNTKCNRLVCSLRM